MIYAYPPEVHEFVKKWAPKLRDRDLAEACNQALGTNFNADRMKAFRGNHGYRNGKKQWTKEEYWKYQKYYPQGMYEFVRDNSWGVSSQEMADMVSEKFGISFTATAMKQFRQRHGIKSGVTGWFRKGRAPGNKGKKLEEFVGPERAAEIRERIKATQFKKGHAPPNELPIGSIVINHDGYKLIKVRMKGTQWERWAFLNRIVWEEAHGPIPEGSIITFADGDRGNCALENLVLETKAQHAVKMRQKWKSYDRESAETLNTLADLKMTISKKKRRKR